MRLKELRKERDLTQFELAKALNIGQATIAGYENGTRTPHIESLIAYADFFDCTIDYLLGRTDDIGNISPAIPAREQQLLADFRSLAPALQEMLLATIETWKGSKANASTGKRA